VFVVGSLEIGGAEMQAVGLAKRLTLRGHDVRIVALMRGGELERDLRDAGVQFRILYIERLIGRSARGRIDAAETLRGLRILARFARWLRNESIDVVHAFLLWPSAITLPLAAMSGVRVRVSGRRNLGTDVAGRRYPVVERVAARASHHVVAVSRAVADAVIAQGVPSHKIRVFYNAVEIPRSPARAVETQPPRGVMIANLIHYKGHRDLVEAMKLLDHPPPIDCYGDGPERGTLERMIADADLTGVITLRGLAPHAARSYLDAQFAVLASHEEGMPGAVLEAMAAGLPVVATAVGGVTEVVRDGETGLLVPPRDPVRLSHAIERLASDPDLRVRLGKNARREAGERFSWERCVREHELLYLKHLR
jgi:glycosyltransferase involved in cell wall biosynthesis